MIAGKKVRQLPEEVIKKIAAGEIVDRPANVLKELIENSIDAGADNIEVYIEKGGKKLIQVKDNGEGIYPEDLPEVIKRYTTSKISSIDDMYNLHSYGFRGEALYSISAVSKFSITSKPEDIPLGKELYVEGGVIKYISETGAPTGTTVKVRDLFYNVPARQKFLKSEKTELVHIIDVFIKYALKHTDKTFRLIVDGKEKFNLTPADIENRIRQIYPKVQEVFKIEYENEIGKVEGYISLNEAVNKKGIIYVNDRPIKSWVLDKVLKSTFGKNFYILFIELPPYFVDFNVHPSKEEVKFKKDAPVIDLIKRSAEYIKTPVKKKSDVLRSTQTLYQKEVKFKVLGQVEDTFLVVYLDGDIYLVDQHVAHERINFYLLKKKYLTYEIPKKFLDNPIVERLSVEDIKKIETNQDKLFSLGYIFDIEANNLFIKAIPSFVEEKEAKDLFFDVLDELDKDKPIEDILAEISCKSSITSGDLLSDKEAQALLKNWLLTDNPNLCPHGRPIYYRVSLDQVRKIVGRR